MLITKSDSFMADFSTLPNTAKSGTLKVVQAALHFSSMADILVALSGTVEITARGFTYSIRNNFQHVLGSLIVESLSTGELFINIVLFE